MKLALFADIHSNLEALSACLDHARQQGADRHAFLGDLVGYGADPGAVLELVEQHVAQGAVAVLGNHDAAVLGRPVEPMTASAQAAIEWTRAVLSARQRSFLDGLPMIVREDPITFVHASAVAPEQWDYVSSPLQAQASMRAAGTTYLFCGHVHEPVLYYIGAGGRPMPFQPVPGSAIPIGPHRQWLAIVGSAGQPRDGNYEACYALLDLPRARLTFFRVPYDVATAAAKVRAAGLPERLALRLENGG
ncbi:metallophosphoesterase family protein [Aquincola sp. S2]|uniref:Metallophosphoesterase family protein n=1 Tax=Pseudaquabacterium terrae TaxID=2732868 RepID=A0ABX2EGA8_9BURK|nr:metallophosphoesterase family protein [Aquabacterium terrae]NRF67633.1 metallophosphoesterase family protein [Aquabacterium terrae]